MRYIVHFLDNQGVASALKVEAPSKADARWLSRIPERRIVEVREDYLGRAMDWLQPRGPDIKNQAIFLQSMSSSMSTGKTVHQAVRSQLANARWLKVKPDKLAICDSLVDYLMLFRFDRFAILLARTAEKTGQYARAMRQASQYLIARERVATEVAGELRTGITYIVLGLLFMLLIPLFIGTSMAEIQSNRSMQFQGNDFTRYLQFMGMLLSQYGWAILLSVVGLVAYARRYARYLRRLPLLHWFYQRRLLTRGLQFLSAYRMLHEAGCVDKDIVLELLNASQGADRDVYQHIHAHLTRSQDLASAFREEDWSLTVRDGISVFADVDQPQQLAMLEAMLETTQMESVHVTRQISRSLGRIGFTLMIVSVLTAVLGFYVPIITAVTLTF